MFRKPASLKRVETVLIPYLSFDLIVDRDGNEQQLRIAIDALVGNTTFFVADSHQFDSLESPVGCEFVLNSKEAKDAAVKEYKGQLLEYGLRNKKAAVVRTMKEAKRFYYPFWVGYFQKKSGYDFQILDAVSGEMQGMKMRKVLLSAFRHLDSD